MNYRVKMQKVERASSRSFYINFPMPLAKALGVEKGEVFEWSIRDLDTFVVRRVEPPKRGRKG